MIKYTSMLNTSDIIQYNQNNENNNVLIIVVLISIYVIVLLGLLIIAIYNYLQDRIKFSLMQEKEKYQKDSILSAVLELNSIEIEMHTFKDYSQNKRIAKHTASEEIILATENLPKNFSGITNHNMKNNYDNNVNLANSSGLCIAVAEIHNRLITIDLFLLIDML